MTVYLSPGVYTREIDLSVLPNGQAVLRPAFIGAANKGPMNEPTFITSAQQYIDTFGEPFADSYLGYAVLAYLQEGASCYVMRVGLEYREGLPDSIDGDAIDTSGANNQGWGRIPVFTGIDYGTISFRTIDSDNPVVLHTASTGAASFTDADDSGSDATMSVTGTYTGCLDDVITVMVTSDPDGTGDEIDGAGYEVINSAGEVLESGSFVADSGTTGASESITITDIGLSFTVNVTGGPLNAGDFWTFTVRPDNRNLVVLVENVESSVTLTAGTYSTATTFVAAINAALVGTSVDYEGVVIDDLASIRTSAAGEWIQVTGSCAFATEVGISQYAYDIPRSYLIGLDEETYNITSSNNRVVIDVIGTTETPRADFTLPVGNGYTASAVASVLHTNGTIDGTRYFESFTLTVPGGEENVVIITTTSNKFDKLKMLVTFSYLSTLRFAELLGIAYPYTRSYRSFFDDRRVLPDIGTDGETPLSCEDDPAGDDCALDTSYYQNVVGWFVAKYPGEWSDDYQIGLDVYTDGLGDAAGRYKVTVYDADGVAVDVVTDVSFDSTATRYIGNVVNEGSTIGGINGNDFYQWEMRPTFLVDEDDVRHPAAFLRNFTGGANGIPSDAAYSEELDNAVIGSQTQSSGLYALQNSEAYNFSLLAVPGFTSGLVIAQALQFCESRGDVLFLVDPPFGLRDQQVVEWHNGLLTSDLASALNSSYGALYWSWNKVNDVFNGGTIWVPPSGNVAAIFARTARVGEMWFAPAGTRRGRLTSVLDVEYNPTRGSQDLLFGGSNAVNPIVKFINQGVTIWGDKTLLRSSSVLDAVGVRMLMTYIKSNVQVTLRDFVFEQNDGITRAQVKAFIEPFLGDIVARRGIESFVVVCDTSNNTPERIARRELWVSVFIKPITSIRYIALNLVLLRSGQNFTAQEVLAAGGVVTGQAA